MNHIGAVSVPEGRNSRALWAREPTGTAIVFVHGFGGQSVGTWSRFEMFLPGEPKASGADIVFYGYDGLRTPAQTSAALFRRMLNEWMKDPSKFVNGTLPPELHRATTPQYAKLIVVAHSLGALVARKALLDAFKSGDAWLKNDRVHLVLFAPAHRGASVLALAKQSLGGLSFLLAALGLVQHFSVLSDLDPDGLFLKTLVEHHEEALKDHDATALTAKALVVPAFDPVVNSIDFLFKDAAPEVIPNTTHITVCKPADSASETFEVVRRFL